MQEKIIIKVHSDDLSDHYLKEILIDNKTFAPIFVSDEEVMRGFQDIEWLMFTLVMIPVAESALNIFMNIKKEIVNRISGNIKNRTITRNIKISIKVKLPMFSYEKEEEITIEPEKIKGEHVCAKK